MSFAAKIIADSISEAGKRITTYQLRYPRFIHAEAKTHRVINIDSVAYEETFDLGFMNDPNLSRNASSSRAIPVKRLIQDIIDDPAMPIYWGSHKPGMQAGEELDNASIAECEYHWIAARDVAIYHAEKMVEQGLHKQIANRILEPWCHMNVVVTATEWDNFFLLRAHEDAQPEIHELALTMLKAREQSTPQVLRPGEYHLPYIVRKTDEWDVYNYIRDQHHPDYPVTKTEIDALLLKISTARCARVSYLTHEGKPTTIEADLGLYDMLVIAKPEHASPCEHQATPDHVNTWDGEPEYANPKVHGNFIGWQQHRKLLGL